MREYLYIDTARLQKYTDQISSPVVYDKIPELNVEVSLLGPKAGGSQKRAARSRTPHENLQLFEDHIRSNGLLVLGRPPMMHFEDLPSYYCETFEAFSGVISSEDYALKLWLSRDEDGGHFGVRKRAIILIQDFRGDDSRQHVVSSYSGLVLLARQLKWLSDTPLNGFLDAMMKHRYFEDQLATKPFATLEQLGVKFGPPRKITALYRFRASCLAATLNDGFLATVIGYPIAIWQK